MSVLVVVVIALGWLALAAGWLRERFNQSTQLRYSSSMYGLQSAGRFAAPRTEQAALLRRQQVLASLVIVAVLTLIMTSLWSLMWALHIAADIAAIAFVAAWYMRSPTRQTRPVFLTQG